MESNTSRTNRIHEKQRNETINEEPAKQPWYWQTSNSKGNMQNSHPGIWRKISLLRNQYVQNSHPRIWRENKFTERPICPKQPPQSLNKTLASYPERSELNCLFTFWNSTAPQHRSNLELSKRSKLIQTCSKLENFIQNVQNDLTMIKPIQYYSTNQMTQAVKGKPALWGGLCLYLPGIRGTGEGLAQVGDHVSEDVVS